MMEKKAKFTPSRSQFSHMMDLRLRYNETRLPEHSAAAGSLERIVIPNVLSSTSTPSSSPLLLIHPGVLENIMSFLDKQSLLFRMAQLNKMCFGRVSEFIMRRPLECRDKPHSSSIARKIWLCMNLWCHQCHSVLSIGPPWNQQAITLTCRIHGEHHCEASSTLAVLSALQRTPTGKAFLDQEFEEQIEAEIGRTGSVLRAHLLLQLSQERFSVSTLSMWCMYMTSFQREDQFRALSGLAQRLLHCLSCEPEQDTVSQCASLLLCELEQRFALYKGTECSEGLAELIYGFVVARVTPNYAPDLMHCGLIAIAACASILEPHRVRPLLPLLVSCLDDPRVCDNAELALCGCTLHPAMRQLAPPVVHMLAQGGDLSPSACALAVKMFGESPDLVTSAWLPILDKLLESATTERVELASSILTGVHDLEIDITGLLHRILTLQDSTHHAILVQAVSTWMWRTPQISQKLIARLVRDFAAGTSDAQEALVALHSVGRHEWLHIHLPVIIQTMIPILEDVVGHGETTECALMALSEFAFHGFPLAPYGELLRPRIEALATFPDEQIAAPALDTIGDLVPLGIFQAGQVAPLLLTTERYSALMGVLLGTDFVPSPDFLTLVFACLNYNNPQADQLVGDLIKVAPERVALEMRSNVDFRNFVLESEDVWLSVQRKLLI